MGKHRALQQQRATGSTYYCNNKTQTTAAVLLSILVLSFVVLFLSIRAIGTLSQDESFLLQRSAPHLVNGGMSCVARRARRHHVLFTFGFSFGAAAAAAGAAAADVSV